MKILTAKFMYFIFASLLFLVGCKKFETNFNADVEQKVVSDFFKNSDLAEIKYYSDVQLIKKNFVKYSEQINKIKGEILWKNASYLKNSDNLAIPVSNGKVVIGFILFSKNVSKDETLDYYIFTENYKNDKRILNSKEAFYVNVIFNKVIFNKTKYEFANISCMPTTFKLLTNAYSKKIDKLSKIVVNFKLNIDSQTFTENFARRICDWVEIANFQFELICWFDDGNGGLYAPFAINYSDPYGVNTNPNQGGNSTGSNSSLSQMVGYIHNEIPTFDPTGMNFIALMQNDEQTITQVFFYLLNSTQPNKREIAKLHLEKMIESLGWGMTDYRQFVYQHRVNSNNNFLWWEDDIWLNNSNNFNFDIDYNTLQGNPDLLTLDEKSLLKQFPVESFMIYSNIPESKLRASILYPSTQNSGLNDKADAFRHAYFHALNVVTIKQNFPTISNSQAASFVKLFSDAHETDVPPQLALEKLMDLHNNDYGLNKVVDILNSYYIIIFVDITTPLQSSMLNGNLMYLKPLNHSDPYWYKGPNGLPITATNGITNSTVLTPTNM